MGFGGANSDARLWNRVAVKYPLIRHELVKACPFNSDGMENGEPCHGYDYYVSDLIRRNIWREYREEQNYEWALNATTP